MIVDLNKMRGVGNARVMDSIVDGIIKKAADEEDRIYLSDLLISHDVAEPLLRKLREDPNRKYTLFCIRDRWGNDLKPGDVVKRRYKKSLKRDNMPIPNRELNDMIRSGLWEEKMHTYEDFVVDKKGCITVNAKDAEYFLTHFGIHGRSGQRISFHPDVSGEPQKDKITGKTRIVWYWRFKELELAEYKAAPKISKASNAGKNEGEPPKE